MSEVLSKYIQTSITFFHLRDKQQQNKWQAKRSLVNMKSRAEKLELRFRVMSEIVNSGKLDYIVIQ